MAEVEFREGQVIKTARQNDLQGKVVDGKAGATSTKFVNVVNEGDAYSAGNNDAGFPTMVRGTDGNHHEMLADALGHPLVAIVPISGTATICDPKVFTGTGQVLTAYNPTGSVFTDRTHAKVITATKTAMNVRATCTSTGLVKWQLGIFDGTVFTPKKVKITSPANPSADIAIAFSPTAPAGPAVLSVQLVVTNLDVNDTDAFSTLEWTEM